MELYLTAMVTVRSVTCYMGSLCYLPPDKSEHTPPLPQPDRPVLDYLPQRDGTPSWTRWHGYIPRWFTHLQSADGHPS